MTWSHSGPTDLVRKQAAVHKTIRPGSGQRFREQELNRTRIGSNRFPEETGERKKERGSRERGEGGRKRESGEYKKTDDADIHLER